MAFTSGDKLPYAPPATVIEVLRRYRERGIPGPLTTESLVRASVPDSLARRTLQTFKLLGLVDSEGNPEPPFAEANRLPGPEYTERMQDLICGAYSEVLQFADPKTDSYEKVRDAFRAYDPQGQQDRMVSLFMGLMEYVGIDISGASIARTRPEVSSPSLRTRKSPPRAPQNGTPKPRGVAKQKPLKSMRGLGAVYKGDLQEFPAGIIGLLRQIPSEGQSWTSEDRDRFIRAFEAVIDFTYPVDDSTPDQYATPEGEIT